MFEYTKQLSKTMHKQSWATLCESMHVVNQSFFFCLNLSYCFNYLTGWTTPGEMSQCHFGYEEFERGHTKLATMSAWKHLSAWLRIKQRSHILPIDSSCLHSWSISYQNVWQVTENSSLCFSECYKTDLLYQTSCVLKQRSLIIHQPWVLVCLKGHMTKKFLPSVSNDLSFFLRRSWVD